MQEQPGTATEPAEPAGPADPTETGRAAVLVGVDGSAAGLVAVELAAREAVLRGRPLQIVHAWIWPLLRVPDLLPEGPAEDGLRQLAERTVAEAAARARSVAPELPVRTEIIAGAPVAVLLECGRDAALTVIGDRGLGGFTGLLAGSVAVQLAAHTRGPVLIARGDPTAPAGPGIDAADHADRRPVLVGVDGSAANEAAVGYGFEAAALRGAPLVALHAWRQPVPPWPGGLPAPPVYTPEEVRRDLARLLAEAFADRRRQFPDVQVRQELPCAGVRRALIEASAGAQLVVVGSRGRGGFAGLLLGSVSQAVLHHAACPVAVVPGSSIGPRTGR